MKLNFSWTLKDWRETTEEQIDELANLNLFKDYTNVRPRRRKDDNDHHEGEPPTQEDTDHCELCEQEANGVQVGRIHFLCLTESEAVLQLLFVSLVSYTGYHYDNFDHDVPV